MKGSSSQGAEEKMVSIDASLARGVCERFEMDAKNREMSEDFQKRLDEVIESVIRQAKCHTLDNYASHVDQAISSVITRKTISRAVSNKNVTSRDKRCLDNVEDSSIRETKQQPDDYDALLRKSSDKYEREFYRSIDPSLYTCGVCNSIRFSEQMVCKAVEGEDICKQCNAGRRGNIENFDPGKCPILEQTNGLEGRMLNIISVFMTIIQLPGGQKGEIGQAIHFPNELDQVVVSSAPYTRFADVVLLRTNQTEKRSFVRLSVLRECFAWLRKNNRLFESLKWDTLPFFLQLMKLGGTVSDAFPTLSNSGYIDKDYSPPNIGDFLDRLRPVDFNQFSVPRCKKSPISYFDCAKLEEKCFVTLFPYGVNGYSETRHRRYSLQQYFKGRLLGRDNRFRIHPSYLFWALNLMEQERLQQRINIALKTKHVDSDGLKPIDIEKILKNKNYTFVQKVRGSVGYWMNVLMNLLCKVATLGPPTWFLTLSADDLGWPDYKELLSADVGDTSHFQNVVRNPVLCSLQFQRRWLAIRRFIKKSKVLGEVTDTFERVEFQNRGSPHLHIFLWVQGAPKLSDSDVPAFLDKYISTRIPEDDNDRRLVEKYQLHKHTSSCLKGRNSCRFRYPRALCSATRVVKGRYLGMKRFYETARFEGDEWVNSYNMTLLRVFRANMDLQFVGDAYGVAIYVCSYLCKTEPDHFKQTIENVLNLIKSQYDKLSARQILSKFGTAILTKRCVSAQEAAFRVLGIPLCNSSRKTVYVNCRPQKERYRVVDYMMDEIGQSEFENTESVQVIFKPSLIEHYCHRPKTDEFKAMCLARFAVWYTVPAPRTASALPLTDGVTFLAKRTKAACLRTPCFGESDNPELFYFRLLMLHLPFRNEVDLLSPFATYREAFMHKKLRFDVEFFGIEVLHTELQRIIQKLRILESSNLGDLGEQTKREVKESWHLVPDEHVGESLIVEEQSLSEELEQDVEAKMFNMFTAEMGDADFAAAVSSLNEQQANILEFVRASLIKWHNDGEPLRLFVSGAAGTGKSFVIKLMSELFLRLTRSDNPSVIRAALTGVAARNINGITLHKAFILPVDHGRRSPLWPLKPETLQRLRRFYKDLNMVIIDEVSMVSKRVFDSIHQRLCELKGNTRPFGGANVVVLGDFCQLRPVMDSFLFRQVPHMLHLFNDLFHFSQLTMQMRQSSDVVFSQLLGRLRLGETTNEDVQLLLTRVDAHSREREFDEALRVFPTREQVRRYNALKLGQLESKGTSAVVHITADDCGTDGKSVADDDAGGLPQNLSLAVNCRIMLIRNVSCDDGLTNGSLGTVLQIENTFNPLEGVIEVKFDHMDNVVALEPMNVKFQNGQRILCERKQFPLSLAWASTVHKIQGLTLSKIVLDIGKAVFQPAMAYVGLSRVRSLKDVSLSDFTKKSLRCFKEVKAYYSAKAVAGGTL